MENKKKIFAGDSFFTAGNQLDVASTAPLTVAFIGGSLTEGEVDYEGTTLENENLKWANVVIKFLSGLFPLRPIKAVNAGLGGTGSDYGAMRFDRDVLSHKPDLVFIEFSCNDTPGCEADCEGNGKR
ncbi:MAG: SGNH/GDSL hydrolase family protein, partial [Clostridia bacterium]|nr:SGNH/GDSL hydrolase family protein [Clostridia bacterium]